MAHAATLDTGAVPAEAGRVTRGGLGLALQLAISIALLALLARRIPLADTLAAFRHVRPVTLAAAAALSLVAYLGRAWRWSSLLARAGIVLPAVTAYALTLAGTAYGLVTPGRVGEFARILHMQLPRSRTLPSVIWDRVGDLLLLELMSIPAFLVIPAWRGVLFAIYLAMVAATFALVFALDRPAFATRLGRIVPPLARPLAQWTEHSAGMLGSRAFRVGLLSGLFFYAFIYAGAWLLVRDLAPQASPLLVLGFPIIPLLGNLPIAFGGLGLREQVSASIFGGFGAGAAVGPAFSLLWFAVATLLPGLVGLLLAPTPWARVRPALETR